MSSKKKGGLADQNLLHALLPGAKVADDGKISVDIGISKGTIIFNIGGTKFETYKSTLFKQPNSPLADDAFLQRNYREETHDYFFDRDPDVFKAILNYLRTGELHIPSHLCGPAVKRELQFWGVEDDVIQKCCWGHYNSWNSTLTALNQLEKDRRGTYLADKDGEQISDTCWGRVQPRVWNLLNKPTTSIAARIYSIVSLLFVILSIISFVTETLPEFNYSKLIDKPGYEVRSQSLSQNSNMTTDIPGNVTSNITTPSGSGKQRVILTHPVFFTIDIICIAFFTIEYAARIIFARKRWRFITSLIGVIDLLALLPDYIQFIVYGVHPELRYEGSVDFIAIVRIARILRIFRLIRHVPGLWILVYTLRSSIQELMLMCVFLLVGVLLFSSLIYYVDDESVFQSIPHSFWWALITMTTVGYGDMYPITLWGKLIGSLTALSGLLMIGFSVPVLVNNFIMYYKHMEYADKDDMVDKQKTRRPGNIELKTENAKAMKSANNNLSSDSITVRET
ncbi:hypothetical protein FSP39_014463 [Pinctada imbricata]|uniref:BTB domain-containing protein n=1 Tax=Pinctada imbricata TaxID=66713 RepID=A0AA88YF16_PINIB|nr:hypothetical protein FSP39_014463 [Pinctada imbricata]